MEMVYVLWLCKRKTTLWTTQGRKERREGKMAVNQTRANDRLLAVTNGSVAEGSVIDLEVVGSVPVYCHFHKVVFHLFHNIYFI